MLPLAHVGHYAVWVLYALPVLVVLVAIVRTSIAQRHGSDDNAEG